MRSLHLEPPHCSISLLGRVPQAFQPADISDSGKQHGKGQHAILLWAAEPFMIVGSQNDIADAFCCYNTVAGQGRY
jgi:hypothetical protein